MHARKTSGSPRPKPLDSLLLAPPDNVHAGSDVSDLRAARPQPLRACDVVPPFASAARPGSPWPALEARIAKPRRPVAPPPAPPSSPAAAARCRLASFSDRRRHRPDCRSPAAASPTATAAAKSGHRRRRSALLSPGSDPTALRRPPLGLRRAPSRRALFRRDPAAPRIPRRVKP